MAILPSITVLFIMIISGIVCIMVLWINISKRSTDVASHSQNDQSTPIYETIKAGVDPFELKQNSAYGPGYTGKDTLHIS